jgi:hypothetical protein
VVGVVAEDFALAGGGADLGFDAEQDRDVLIGMEAVGDEKGDHDDVGGGGDLSHSAMNGCSSM